MLKSINFWTAVGLAAVICGAAALFTHHSTPSLPDDPTAIFDQHLPTRVQMHDSNQWFLDYQKDVSLDALVDRHNGETVEVEYWGTGRPGGIKSARVFYPPTQEQVDEQVRSAPTVKTDEGTYQIIEPKDKVKGQLKRAVDFDAAGMIVKDRGYWDSGERKHVGDRTADYQFVMDDYDQDGDTILTHRELVALPSSTYASVEYLKDPTKKIPVGDKIVWRVMRGVAYRDGRVWQTAERQLDNSLFIFEMGDTGAKISRTWIKPSESAATRTYFADDGKTPGLEVDQTPTSDVLRYFENGRVVKELEYPSSRIFLEVTYFNEAGKKNFKQRFDLKKGLEYKAGKMSISNYVLTRVTQFDENNVGRKQIDWSADGDLDSIFERNPGVPPAVIETEYGSYVSAFTPGTNLHYRKDGTLELFMRQDESSNVVERREVTPEENVRPPEIDPTLTVLPELDQPLPSGELWNNPFAPKR